MEHSCEIVEHLETLSKSEKSGWTKEFNLVSWNGDKPRLEVRSWSPDYSRAGKCEPFTAEEFERMISAYRNNPNLNKDFVPDYVF